MIPSQKKPHGVPAFTDAPNSHPSFFVLDRLYMDQRAGVTEEGTHAERSHVEGCSRCRAYLAALDREAEKPLPAWTHRQEAVSPWTRLYAVLFRPSFVGPALGAVALVLIFLFPFRHRDDPALEHPAITAKGGPGVNVYVKRGEHVTLWDGRAPLYPRDRIRLEVAGAGFRHVTVASPKGTGASLTSLYTGPLRMDAPTQLPASWTLDEARGTETLHVILSHRPLSADSLDLSQLLSESQIALHTLIFRKEALK